jgi:hypothetical protein
MAVLPIELSYMITPETDNRVIDIHIRMLR